MAKRLFVIGTGTDVGKTYVTGLILKKLNQAGKKAAYYKAAMSGNDRDGAGNLLPGDALQVKALSGISQPVETMCPYVYETAVSPHLASQIEGNPVEMEKVLEQYDALCRDYDYVTAEGSGGILCPLRWDDRKIWLEDFVKARQFPCVLVADAGLGTINAVVLTAHYLESQGIALKGILFNRYDPDSCLHRDNLAMCQVVTGKKVLGVIRADATELDLDLSVLLSLYE